MSNTDNKNSIMLSIVTPNGQIFDGEVKTVFLPGKEGEFGVLSGHMNLVSTLGVGVIDIERLDGSKDLIAINWGHVKVDKSSVDVLVDGAVALSSNDSDIAQNIANAKELVNSVKDDNTALGAVVARIEQFSK